MNTDNCTFGKKTVGLPLTEIEENVLNAMLKQTGIKKQFYIRNLVIADLSKTGWLPQKSEELKGVQNENN